MGGLAVYDIDFDITWLADANALAGTAYDGGGNATDGRTTWGLASAWAENLNVAGVTGWRLPTALNSDGSGLCVGANCIDSEMGHLFYNELGGVSGGSVLDSGDPDLALFSNIQAALFSSQYWSGTTDATDSNIAWIFTFSGGTQAQVLKIGTVRAWAVHSGDVGELSVPEPGAVTLLSIGLVALLSFGRRQR